MSLSYIPFQPVYFGELPQECCTREGCGIGGTYLAPVQRGDITQFQLSLGICAEATQLFNDPNFIDALQGWSTGYIGDFGIPDWADNAVTLHMGVYIFQNTNLQPNTKYLVRVDVLSIQGELSIYSDSDEVIIQESGFHDVVLQMGANPVVNVLARVLDDTNSIVVINSVSVYQWYETSDIDVEVGGETVPDSAKTITGGTLTVKIDWDALELPDGQHTIQVTDGCGKGAETMTSQPFLLADHHPCTIQLYGCIGGDNLGFDFSVFAPSARLKYQFNQLRYPNERERFNDTTDRHSVYWGRVEKIRFLVTEDIPEYLLDWISTLPLYSTVFVGGSPYAVENDSIDPEMNENYPSWGVVELEMRMTNYPLVFARCDDEEPMCNVPPNCWLWPTGEPIIWEDDLNNVCIRHS